MQLPLVFDGSSSGDSMLAMGLAWAMCVFAFISVIALILWCFLMIKDRRKK